MKRSFMKALIALIVIVFTNVALFLLLDEFLTTFWICYAFSMIAALITTYIEVFFARKEELIFRYPVSTVTFVYLFVTLAFSLLAMLSLSDYVLFVFLVQLFIFAAYLVMLLSVFIHNSTTKEQQAVRGVDVANFRYILDKMNGIISKAEYTDPNRKVLQHAYDSLLSGQIKSNEAAQVIEQNIINILNSLEGAVANKNATEIQGLCTQLEAEAEERKRVLSSSKLF